MDVSVTAPDGSVWPTGSLRALEHQSIRDFVLKAAKDGYLKGRVLDYGCGHAPYREIVEAYGCEWFGYDRVGLPDNHVGDVGSHAAPEMLHWDAVLCTQVIQYADNPEDFLRNYMHVALCERFAPERLPAGYLVLTYPTNWPEAQEEDLYRFTKAGMERLLTDVGFTIIRHERRAWIRWDVDTFALGYGVICRA